ncbi:hypothetical protein C8F04DRAFT_1179565 [Mycena alexandri]|uniref:Uncharacterized protein n=1 Tax=Mycena alexandri TaxID=1745969 RepID=A0AAD6T725_9AGAR|nr:hypothetical protein C8F04DRAFT_1179565 [Mycena alexandri]
MVLVAPSSKHRCPLGAASSADNPLTLDENGTPERPFGSSLNLTRRRRKKALFGDEPTLTVRQPQFAPRRLVGRASSATTPSAVLPSWMLPPHQHAQSSTRSLDVATRLHRPMVNTRTNASSATSSPRTVLAAITNAGLGLAPSMDARQPRQTQSSSDNSMTVLTIALATSSISTPVQREILFPGRRTRFERDLTLRDLWIGGVEPPARSPEQGKEHQGCAVCKQVKSHPVSPSLLGILAAIVTVTRACGFGSNIAGAALPAGLW